METPGIDKYAFVGNPMVVRDEDFWVLPDTMESPGSYVISVGGAETFRGKFFPPLDMDIAEMVRTALPPLPDTLPAGTEPVALLEDAAGLAKRGVSADFTFDGSTMRFTCTAFPGGVSRQNWRQYIAADTDPFTARFLNRRANIFFSTRSDGRTLTVRETELEPLIFMLSGEMMEVKITTGLTSTPYLAERLDTGLYALDPVRLRRWFAEKQQVFPSLFDFHIDGVCCCRILIEEAKVSDERYTLRYRNSLGAMERMEVVGRLWMKPRYGEEGEYMKFDPVVRDFVAERRRQEKRDTLEVSSGPKRPEEFRMILEMLASPEVWLEGLTVEPVRVIPSAEDLSAAAMPTAPAVVDLSLKCADSDRNIMADILAGHGARKGGIFTCEFENVFE